MKTLTTLSILLLAIATIASRRDADEPINQDRTKVKPLFDTPLRHTHILRAPDQHYYLTGTSPSAESAKSDSPDFQNNKGVRLWKSKNLKNWQDLGLVWDLEKQATPWQQKPRLNPHNPQGSLVRGVTTPEILHVKDNYYIAYSMNGHGCGLLKSASGKPEGPYEDLGQITATGGSPSLFEDQDGSVHFIWGQGNIAKMNDSLTKITGETRNLLANVQFDLEDKEKFFGSAAGDPVNPHGFRVQRYKEKRGEGYLVTFAAENCRFGRHLNESFTLKTDQLDGKLGFPRMVVTNSGENNLFQDEKGNWFGTFSGADQLAEFRDRPAIVPLKPNYHGDLSNRRTNFFTMRGPWDTVPFCRPELPMNDAMILAAPDGHYYLAGSNWTQDFYNQVMLYRSKDLKNWTRHKVFEFTDVPWVDKIKKRHPEFLEKKKNGWGQNGGGTPWNMEIHHLGGKYYMAFQLAARGLSKEAQKYAQELTQGKTCVIIASENPLGPYKYHTSIGCSMPSFLEDDDKTIYMTMGGATKMKPDMTDFAERRQNTKQKEELVFSYDPIGSYMIKIGDKYIYGTENLYGGYDGQYWVADAPNGPFGRPRVHMPHGGHAGMFKGHDGKYYAVMWQAFKDFSPTAMPLHVEQTEDDVVIIPEYEKN